MNSEFSMDQVLIEKIYNILETNLDKEHFGVKELATQLSLSRSQLHRKLISITGKSASRYIREFRLKKAMRLLQKNVATASEIAYQVGFGSPTYFNTCFHDYYGFPPGEVKYRNSILSENSEEKTLTSSSNDFLQPTIIYKNIFSRRMVWFNTIAIVILTVFSFILYQKFYNITNELSDVANEKNSVALLHFRNLTSISENQIFTSGMMDQIINHLTKDNLLDVKSSQSSEKYRNSDYSALEIGKQLQVNYLVEGSLVENTDNLSLIIRLIDTKHEKNLWSNKYNIKSDQLFTSQTRLSNKIAQDLTGIISSL